jgi:hypothetical protein
MEAVVHKIRGDGRCMYNSILYSLEHHPLGSLRERVPFESVDELTTMLVTHPSWTKHWSSLYDLYCGSKHDRNRDAIRQVREEERSDPTWVKEVLAIKPCIDRHDFLVRAQDEIKQPGPDPNTWGGEFEFSVIQEILHTYGISLSQPLYINNLPLKVNFGTLQKPNIYIVYNGNNHFDAYVAKVSTNQEFIEAAKPPRVWNELGMTEREYTQAAKIAMNNETRRLFSGLKLSASARLTAVKSEVQNIVKIVKKSSMLKISKKEILNRLKELVDIDNPKNENADAAETFIKQLKKIMGIRGGRRNTTRRARSWN